MIPNAVFVTVSSEISDFTPCTYRQCTLCLAYHSLLEAPLFLEALGVSLYSLLVNTALIMSL